MLGITCVFAGQRSEEPVQNLWVELWVYAVDIHMPSGRPQGPLCPSTGRPRVIHRLSTPSSTDPPPRCPQGFPQAVGGTTQWARGRRPGVLRDASRCPPPRRSPTRCDSRPRGSPDRATRIPPTSTRECREPIGSAAAQTDARCGCVPDGSSPQTGQSAPRSVRSAGRVRSAVRPAHRRPDAWAGTALPVADGGRSERARPLSPRPQGPGGGALLRGPRDQGPVSACLLQSEPPCPSQGWRAWTRMRLVSSVTWL